MRIYLVGFMGSGKTSVGRALSRRLGLSFLDLDAEIERAERMTVQEIFAARGEPYFRNLERDHLARVSKIPNAVIALGGGAYIDPENQEIADSTGLTVWLNTPFSTIRQRVKMDGSRPLFGDNDQAERLFRQRLPAYEKARLHISVENRNSEVVAEEIVNKMDPHL